MEIFVLGVSALIVAIVLFARNRSMAVKGICAVMLFCVIAVSQQKMYDYRVSSDAWNPTVEKLEPHSKTCKIKVINDKIGGIF